MRAILALLFFLFAVVQPVLSRTEPKIIDKDKSVVEHKLSNGMKILIKPDHRAPVVTSQVWYKIGSADEYAGITGISHVLEHMMFKGTQKNPVGQMDQKLAAVGATNNAFTGKDYTAYYELLGSEHLETSFELESDRMANLNLLEKEFRKEIEVVKEERRLRTDDNPNALAYEQLIMTAFNLSPYGQPVIGWMNDLDNLTVEDVRDWYRLWYSPNNATLVVVGDVLPDAVIELAEQYFGKIPKQDLPAKKPRIERTQFGEKRITLNVPAKLPYLLIGYKTPVLATATQERDAYALTVLAAILDGGHSARFAKQLVREQELAASAGAGYDMHEARSNLFLFDGTPAEGHTVDELEQAIYRQIEQLQQEPPAPEELARVKAQVIANEVYQQDSVQGQAYVIGALETAGLGWAKMNEFVPGIKAVTAQQVQSVANKYLVKTHRTVAILNPVEKQGASGSNPD